MRNLLLFGGTFDPIHNAHLNVAINVQNHFNFDRFVFLPCKIPVLKNKSIASSTDRLAMLELALKEYPHKNFEVDTREINRASPSYMITTLEDYRNEIGESLPIILLIGEDTFEKLSYWHRWQELLSMASILLINRSGTPLKPDAALKELLLAHETDDEQELIRHPYGVIFRFDAGLYDLSSTAVRQQLKENHACEQIPLGVANYIRQRKLYLE